MSRPYWCTGLILQCLILCKCNTPTVAITTHKDNISPEFLIRLVGRALSQCLLGTQKLQCLEEHFERAVDTALQDNNTWHYSDYIFIEKRPSTTNAPTDRDSVDTFFNQTNYNNNTNTTTARQQRALSGRLDAPSLSSKLLQLAKSRVLRMQLPRTAKPFSRKGNGISDAIDSLSGITNAASTAGIDSGLLESETADEGIKESKKKKKQKKKKKKKKDKIWYLNKLKNPLKGRKKKDKDKNMAMMGGMAMMAMVAQMFLGKVILIAGAAFIMAKIALLVSVLGSLKKGSSGSSGSTTEHVIVTGGGGGHGHDSHDSGWHRSMPPDYPPIETIMEEPHHTMDIPPSTPPEDHKPSSYYDYKMGESEDGGGFDGYKRRQTSGFL